jgi:hypothetical protein
VTNGAKDSDEDQPRPAVSLSRMLTKGRPLGRNVVTDLMNLRAAEVLQWVVMVGNYATWRYVVRSPVLIDNLVGQLGIVLQRGLSLRTDRAYEGALFVLPCLS